MFSWRWWRGTRAPSAGAGNRVRSRSWLQDRVDVRSLRVSTAERSRRSRAWNDKKVTAHHAIIPTVVAALGANLSPAERKVYDLVARRYLAQFLPAFEYNETRIELEVAGERFRASGRRTVDEGWRALFPPVAGKEREERDIEGEEPEGEQSLPLVRDGEKVACVGASISEKQTRPPKRFTEATLIEAMTGISRYVDDPKIKQLLKETDGIGTAATQADIIETLFERGFIEKRARQIVSTAVGRALHGSRRPRRRRQTSHQRKPEPIA